MWDDAVQMQGRQTKRKWKWICILLVLAMVCILGARLAMYPDVISEQIAQIRARFHREMPSNWVQTQEENMAVSSGDVTVFAGTEGIRALDFTGTLRYQLTMDWEEPVLKGAYNYAAAYEPGGRTLVISGEEEARKLEVSTGIDLAVPGPEGICAVITSGSGYLTQTNIYADTGELKKQIGLTDQAMAMMTFLEDGTLVSCCVDRTGAWYLRLDREAETLELPIPEKMVYELQACGTGFALWTSTGVCFYDAQGNNTGIYEIRDDAVLAWDCGDFAAVLIRRFGTYRLLNLSPTGEAVEKELDFGLPKTLLVCGKWVCMLDREALLVYDKNGTFVQRSLSGARAGEMISADDGLVLLGDGEMLYMKIP